MMTLKQLPMPQMQLLISHSHSCFNSTKGRNGCINLAASYFLWEDYLLPPALDDSSYFLELNNQHCQMFPFTISPKSVMCNIILSKDYQN